MRERRGKESEPDKGDGVVGMKGEDGERMMVKGRWVYDGEEGVSRESE